MKAMAAVLACLALPARAAFQEPPLGARSLGMARATIALDEGSDALFANPAGPGGGGGGQLSTAYGRLFMGLPGVPAMGVGSVSGSVAAGRTAVSLGLGQFQASGLLEELTAALGLSRGFGPLRLGVAGKRLSHRYLVGDDALAAQDPVFSHGTGRGGWAVDAGALLALTRSLTVGAAARNLNEPDIGLDSADRVPRESQAGAAWRVTPGLTLTGDVISREGQPFKLGQGLVPAAGLEASPFGRSFALRVGASPLEVTAGFGVAVGRWRVDYGASFKLGLLSDNAGAHRVGVSYAWGQPD